MMRGVWCAACALCVLVACSEGEQEVVVPTSECATGLKWDAGDEGSPLMNPGEDCIACHKREGEGPDFTVAGTVFPGLMAADDCYGVEGATVIITGADGVEHRMTTNKAGNFFTEKAIKTPYTARVSYQGKERVMLTPQTSGACASCHGQTASAGAPGRIALPE
jgi:cytochrome c553